MIVPKLSAAFATFLLWGAAHSADAGKPSVTDSLVAGFRSHVVLPVDDKPAAVVVHTWDNSLLVSPDFGATWNPVQLSDVKIMYAYEEQSSVLSVLAGDGIYMSFDKGSSFSKLNAPVPVHTKPAVHPNNTDWLIVQGDSGTYFSADRGVTFNSLMENADGCYFVAGTDAQSTLGQDLVYCEKDSPYEVYAIRVSQPLDANNQKKLEIANLTQVMQAGDFVLAAIDAGAERELAVSTDGVQFEKTRYPPLLPRATNAGVNVLDSAMEGRLLIFEAEGEQDGFGTLLHSGKNGSDFTVTLEKVSRPPSKGGFVDFELLKSVEGVMMANVVQNADDIRAGKALPELRTLISHSDGAQWAPLVGPNGGELQLHSYTDRLTYTEEPTALTASGIFIARGNEGGRLGSLAQAQTYLTTDAGLTWTQISPRSTKFAIGDHGGIIMMADVGATVSSVYYSFDMGASFNEYKFEGEPATVWSIESDSEGKSARFLVLLVTSDRKFRALSFDFNSALPACTTKDFEEFAPAHPQTKSTCMLGREVAYLRRKADAKCIVGKFAGVGEARVVKNCQCSRLDYECDYMHQLDPADNVCKPVMELPSREEQCAVYSTYTKFTGYRKIAGSSCIGDLMDTSEKFACSDNKPDQPQPQQPEQPEQPEEPQPPSQPPNEGGSFGFFKYILVIIVVALIIKFRDRLQPRIQLPVEHEEYLDSVQSWWHTVRSYIPFLSSQIPHDHLGFYSRMDNDERMHILAETSEDEDLGEV